MTRDDNKKALSLRDIAQAASVSVSTVSRVLSGAKDSGKISEHTRQRILEICESKRFLPNIHYRRLHEGLSRVITFMIPPPAADMMFFDNNVGSFLSALEPSLARHGFHILMQSATPEFLEDRRYLELFRSRAVDGAILWDVCRDDDHLDAMVQEGKPLLKVAFPSTKLADQIVPDNFQASCALTQHLIDLGHRHIIHISGGCTSVEDERQGGYDSAMERAGCLPLKIQGAYSYESGYSLAERIVGERPEVTAIMAANDFAAAGCLRRIKELGLRCPQDISVTGFDGTAHSEICDPQVTTADLAMDKIGRMAADRIVSAVLEPGSYRPSVTIVQMPVIIRESTARPRSMVKRVQKKVYV